MEGLLRQSLEVECLELFQLLALPSRKLELVTRPGFFLVRASQALGQRHFELSHLGCHVVVRGLPSDRVVLALQEVQQLGPVDARSFGLFPLGLPLLLVG